VKTLTILFESPNVFKVLPEWPKEPIYCDCPCTFNCTCEKNKAQYNIACQESKANAIRIENPEILPIVTNECDLCDGCGWYEGGPTLKTDCNACKATGLIQFHNHEKLISGDIFQVQGFEYEVETRFTDGWIPTYNNPDNSGCDVPAEPYQVAILK